MGHMNYNGYHTAQQMKIIKEGKMIMMEYKVYYNGQETSDFGTLASWFMEVYNKMRSLEEENRQLEEANNQYKDDMQRLKDGYYQFKISNRSLESDNDKLKKENEMLILAQGSNAMEHAAEIIDLKKEISALKTELEERKNKRSPRWPSDAMRIVTLENKVNKLTKWNDYLLDQITQRNNDVNKLSEENKVLKYSQPWSYGMYVPSRAAYLNSIFGVNGTIHKLREENAKLKDALEFCQKEASSAREHATNVEVNAERVIKGLD